jgi:polyisoprenoid-binding protein YceI
MRQVKRSIRGRTVLAIVAVVIVAAVGVGAVYVFGGGGGSKSSAPVTVPTLAANGNGTIFTIDPSASEATFTINEVLFGQPNTVVGKTSSVAGQIQVNRQHPDQSQVGEIKVDVSTLVTDNDLRNHTLQGRILETGDPANQYATFVPKSLSGMPATVAVGQQFSFQITGDLTIHQVMRMVTFDVKVMPQSETVIEGQAQATVKYQDFGIQIPNVPSVTGVGDTVVLALSFTAHS